MNFKTRSICLLVVVSFLIYLRASAAGYVDICYVCGAGIGDTVYIADDKVSHTKRELCGKCAKELPRCFLCGLPALTNKVGAVQFEDARVICSRDSKDAVIQPDEARQLCEQMTDQLRRQFARFISMPENNLSFETIDRLHLENLFMLVGNDYACPNVLGLTQTQTNSGKLEHHISILIGQPRSEFRSTCAHECAHAWMAENVGSGRMKSISKSAREGFCELVAYLAMDGENEERARILANAYTRGQIHRFIEAERLYGISDVVDWVRYGVDDRLGDDLLKLRDIQAPKRSPLATPLQWAMPNSSASQPNQTCNSISLKAIFWDAKHPTAIINQQTVVPGAQYSVAVGGTNVTFRCLQISKDVVRIRLLPNEEEKSLSLGGSL